MMDNNVFFIETTDTVNWLDPLIDIVDLEVDDDLVDVALVGEEGESWYAHQCWECGGVLKMVPDHHERRLVFTCQNVWCGKVLCSDHNAYKEWLNE